MPHGVSQWERLMGMAGCAAPCCFACRAVALGRRTPGSIWKSLMADGSVHAVKRLIEQRLAPASVCRCEAVEQAGLPSCQGQCSGGACRMLRPCLRDGRLQCGQCRAFSGRCCHCVCCRMAIPYLPYRIPIRVVSQSQTLHILSVRPSWLLPVAFFLALSCTCFFTVLSPIGRRPPNNGRGMLLCMAK